MVAICILKILLTGLLQLVNTAFIQNRKLFSFNITITQLPFKISLKVPHGIKNFFPNGICARNLSSFFQFFLKLLGFILCHAHFFQGLRDASSRTKALETRNVNIKGILIQLSCIRCECLRNICIPQKGQSRIIRSPSVIDITCYILNVGNLIILKNVVIVIIFRHIPSVFLHRIWQILLKDRTSRTFIRNDIIIIWLYT